MKAVTYLPTRGARQDPVRHQQLPDPELSMLREAVTDADGNWTTKIAATVYEGHQDPMPPSASSDRPRMT